MVGDWQALIIIFIKKYEKGTQQPTMIRELSILPDFPDYHDFWGFDPETGLFFDIETTGLSAASSHVFLIGTICHTERGWQLTQYLAEHTSEEPELLAAFFADAAPFSTLIHFNGTTFDLPYINARAKACRLPVLFDGASDQNSVDLYQKLRRLKKLSGAAHMKQKDLETFAGWQREDTLTGKHMVAMFHTYEKTSDPELRRLMLLHNHDDLVGMTHLLPLAAYLMLTEGTFAQITSCSPVAAFSGNTSTDLSFSASDISDETATDCNPDRQDTTEEPQPFVSGTSAPATDYGSPHLCICFALTAPLPHDLSLSIPYQPARSEEKFFQLIVKNSTAIFDIPGIDAEMKYFFPDYKNYYYLPLEDQAIHKSVAAYVEKEYRVPAKAMTCYTRKSGTFYPQPSATLTPAFRSSYESQAFYFAWQEEYEANPELLRPLLTAILQRILS